ncbi:MAG: murein L,D-transpeptidase catalytic domain family protein [Proteobacteria bacterium]|nr:murein L,D-transpeptidase catalytic domain family protein [Pseudomonadota bacterium]
MTTMPRIIKKLANHKKTIFTALLMSICITGNSKPVSDVVLQPSGLFSLKTAKSPSAFKEINPKVLQMAMKAHQKANAMGVARKSLMTIIDYSLPSTKRRLWVLDMNKQKVIYHTLVAHGSGSGGNVATQFSDKPGSLQSSLGVFVTGKTYQGKHGLSLTLHGLEQGINGNAERRRIVVHGAGYVNEGTADRLGRLGRSWGCPALDTRLASPIIQTIKDGSLIFAYYPDNNWLKRSKFL